jgi:uncharacterized protein YggT (Ycf19 family)
MNSAESIELENFLKNLDVEELNRLRFFFRLLLTILSYLYVWIKFYKVLCYGKMTCEWFPMLNPYQWPFSFLQTVTVPYFRFWSKLLPSLKFQKSSVEISGIVALEALNAIIYFCVRWVNLFLVILKSSEKILDLSI